MIPDGPPDHGGSTAPFTGPYALSGPTTARSRPFSWNGWRFWRIVRQQGFFLFEEAAVVRSEHAGAHAVDIGWSRGLCCTQVRGWRLLAGDAHLATAGDDYRLLDQQGRDLGALVASPTVPMFGRNAPTVYLRRATGGDRP